jgi:hypothetical protein
MKQFLLITIASMLFSSSALCAGVTDYLILQDIGSFNLDKPEKMFAGESPSGGPRTFNGAVAVSGHFDADHIDTTYEVMYFDFSRTYYSPTVKVSQHAGADSDKWLLHEMEGVLRAPEKDKLGRRDIGAAYRKVGTAEIFKNGPNYYWISNNITVEIECMNLKIKQEPMQLSRPTWINTLRYCPLITRCSIHRRMTRSGFEVK